jgi:hypothetical protein
VISQIRNIILALLLLAATAPAKAEPPTSAAPPANAAPDAGAAPTTPAPGAVAPNAAPRKASVPGKHGAAADDDSDDKDPGFQPLKKGESFRLLGFVIGGSKHIDEHAIIATLPEHVGGPITNAQIEADTDTVKKALTALHVHYADVTTSLMQREGPGHLLYVIWDIQHEDAFDRAPFQGFWAFGGQTFSGNKALTNEQLEKAIDLKPGERVREGAVSDARTGIEQAYEKVFPGQTVKIASKLILKAKPTRVATFEWQITEPPAK